MSKKKDQIKYLEKEFSLIIKSFKKEKNNKKRRQLFNFIKGHATKINNHLSQNKIETKYVEASETISEPSL